MIADMFISWTEYNKWNEQNTKFDEPITCFLPDQEERSKSVEAFRKQEKDVLVATDVASKGLDFPDIQHVINYDMPDDVENYGK